MSEQTIEAFRAEGNPPTAAGEAAVRYQSGRDSDRHKRQHRVVGISLLVVDGIAIYFFGIAAEGEAGRENQGGARIAEYGFVIGYRAQPASYSCDGHRPPLQKVRRGGRRGDGRLRL